MGPLWWLAEGHPVSVRLGEQRFPPCWSCPLSMGAHWPSFSGRAPRKPMQRRVSDASAAHSRRAVRGPNSFLLGMGASAEPVTPGSVWSWAMLVGLVVQALGHWQDPWCYTSFLGWWKDGHQVRCPTEISISNGGQTLQGTELPTYLHGKRLADLSSLTYSFFRWRIEGSGSVDI